MSTGDITDRVALYERRRARGLDTAIEHEELHQLVSHSIGPIAGAFFDKERTLPLATAGLPWPMKQHVAHSFRPARLMLSALGFLAALLLVPPSALWSVVIAFAVAGAVYCLVTFPSKLVRPKDIDERARLVGVYLDLILNAERSADARRSARQVADDSEFNRITRREFGTRGE